MTTPVTSGFDPRPQVVKVLLALAIGLLLMAVFDGPAVLFNTTLICLSFIACENLAAKLRQQALSSPQQALFKQTYLGDGSSLISSALLALALPAATPWWLCVLSAAFAAILGKALLGGAGRNPINPAMLGFAFALVMFPAVMIHAGQSSAWLNQWLPGALSVVDGSSHATVLDVMRHNQQFTNAELFASHPAFGHVAGARSEWLNLWFLLAGIWLIKSKVIGWQIPAGVLLGLFSASLLGWNGSGSDSNGSPLFHLFSGASMLAAFFIATEPVTRPHNLKASWAFGLAVGILIYLLRVFSNYPDAVAFAILIVGFAVPMLNRWGARHV